MLNKTVITKLCNQQPITIKEKFLTWMSYASHNHRLNQPQSTLWGH